MVGTVITGACHGRTQSTRYWRTEKRRATLHLLFGLGQSEEGEEKEKEDHKGSLSTIFFSGLYIAFLDCLWPRLNSEKGQTVGAAIASWGRHPAKGANPYTVTLPLPFAGRPLFSSASGAFPGDDWLLGLRDRNKGGGRRGNETLVLAKLSRG